MRTVSPGGDDCGMNTEEEETSRGPGTGVKVQGHGPSARRQIDIQRQDGRANLIWSGKNISVFSGAQDLKGKSPS